MYDILAALNAALIPMSAIFLWHFIGYEIQSRHDDKNTPLARFGLSLFCFCVGMFSSSILYYLGDYSMIYESTRIKLSVIPRAFFIAGMTFGFHALEIRWSKTICIVALCLGLGVLIARVIL